MIKTSSFLEKEQLYSIVGLPSLEHSGSSDLQWGWACGPVYIHGPTFQPLEKARNTLVSPHLAAASGVLQIEMREGGFNWGASSPTMPMNCGVRVVETQGGSHRLTGAPWSSVQKHQHSCFSFPQQPALEKSSLKRQAFPSAGANSVLQNRV